MPEEPTIIAWQRVGLKGPVFLQGTDVIAWLRRSPDGVTPDDCANALQRLVDDPHGVDGIEIGGD